MPKIIVSFFFFILFTALISAPTILHAIDDTIDVSIFYSLSEEEEQGHETIKNLEILPSDHTHLDVLFLSNTPMDRIDYCFKKYPKPHLNLISPPPELYI